MKHSDENFLKSFSSSRIPNARLWVFNLYGSVLSFDGQVINEDAMMKLFQKFTQAGGRLLFTGDKENLHYDPAVINFALKLKAGGIIDKSETIGFGRLPSPMFLGREYSGRVFVGLDEVTSRKNRVTLPFTITLADGRATLTLLEKTEAHNKYRLEILTTDGVSHQNTFTIDADYYGKVIYGSRIAEVMYFLTYYNQIPYCTLPNGIQFEENGNQWVRLSDTILLDANMKNCQNFKAYVGRAIHPYSRYSKTMLLDSMQYYGIRKTDAYEYGLPDRSLAKGERSMSDVYKFSETQSKKALSGMGRTNIYIEYLAKEVYLLQQSQGLPDEECLRLEEVVRLVDKSQKFKGAIRKESTCQLF